MNEEEKIGDLVDEVLTVWEEDPSVVFGGESRRLGLLHSSRARRFKKYDSSGDCVYPQCAEKSIKRSHVIQRNGALSVISEGGHVVHPVIGNEGELAIEPIGVGKASTFPGYCQKHEGIFQSFERTGAIDKDDHVVQQAFRTVCREIKVREIGLDEGQIDLESYRRVRDDFIKQKLTERVGDASLKNLEIRNDPLEAEPLRILDQANDMIAHLAPLKERLAKLVEGERAHVDVFGYRLPIEIPVAISGAILSNYRKRSQKVRVAPLVLGLIPEQGSCLVYLSSLSNHRAYLKLLEKRFQFAIHTLNLIEQWMVYGTDHWFLRPSVWDHLPDTRKTRIIELISSQDGVAGIDSAPSIFDDLRQSLIEELILQRGPVRDDTLESIIELESSKLAEP
ncbi:hypothetical protein AAG594_03410 [Citromicrobium bathyomarinum]